MLVAGTVVINCSVVIGCTKVVDCAVDDGGMMVAYKLMPRWLLVVVIDC